MDKHVLIIELYILAAYYFESLMTRCLALLQPVDVKRLLLIEIYTTKV